MSNFTHLDEQDRPGMVDVSAKKITARSATATVTIVLGAEITKDLNALDFQTKKGSIIQTAVLAGTMAAKKTAEAIPLCHNIPLSSIKFKSEILANIGIRLEATVKTVSQTGVEMEALHAASTAALTVYDMCKSRSQNIQITDLKLLQKRGGKSDYDAPETP